MKFQIPKFNRYEREMYVDLGTEIIDHSSCGRVVLTHHMRDTDFKWKVWLATDFGQLEVVAHCKDLRSADFTYEAHVKATEVTQ